MMGNRTNEAWLRDLRGTGRAYDEALAALRDYLMRAALVYLGRRRSDVVGWTAEDLRQFAEDMTQDAILDIEANLVNFRGEAKFTTWAYSFVINRAAGELRRSRYSDFSYEGLQENEAAFFEKLQAEFPDASPELKVEQREMAELLLDVIQNELTIRQRRAMVMAYFQGQSMETVAEQLNISRNTLYKLLFDARQRLKAALIARHLSEGDILAPFEE
jgi:RNA polymerase sigma-70 factor (ECF subfamily)